MPDLLILSLALALPYILMLFGAPPVVISSVNTATLLVWPGYVLSAVVWKKQDFAPLHQRLMCIPLLSILVVAIVSLLAWVIFGKAEPYLVSVAILALALPIGFGTLFARRMAGNATGQFSPNWRFLAHTSLLFIGLSLLIGFVAQGPQANLHEPLLTIYVEPGASPSYDASTQSVSIPLAITNDEPGPPMAVAIKALVAGQPVMIEREMFISGEQHMNLNIPITALPASGPQTVDIVIRTTNINLPITRTLRLRISIPTQP